MNDGEERDAEWRELALRFLTRPVPGAEGSVRPELIVGALPPDLPVEIPVPAGVCVRGSLEAGAHVQVILRSELAPDEVGELYRQRLEAQGWRELDLPRPSGFAPVTGPEYFRTFCRGPEGPALILSATSRYPNAIGLDLNLDPRSSPCRPYRGPGAMNRSLPALQPPADARQTFSGGGGSGGYAHQTASVVAELDLPALTDHYAGQLRAAGWQELMRDLAGPAAWSTWTVRDDGAEKRGIFFVIERSGEPRTYCLYLQLDRSPDDGSWTALSGQ
jgi:hypothetical protein